MRRFAQCIAAVFITSCILSADQDTNAAKILADLRLALGGETALQAVKSFSVTGRRIQNLGRSLESELEITCILPDNFLRVNTRIDGPIGLMFQIIQFDGFTGAEPIRKTETPNLPVPAMIPGGPRHGGIHFEPKEIRTGIGTHGSIGKSLPGECGPAGRRAGFERITGLAALAPEMAQNAVHNPGLSNDGDDPQLGAARAQERVDFEDFPQQARPRAPGFLGEVGIAVLMVVW